MNRRDFLRLRTTPSGKTLELSCRSLYMRCLDSESPAHQPPDAPRDDYQAWMGEPPAVFATSSTADWLRQVENDLREVDVLRVLDGQWLASTSLGDRMEPVLASFKARGGRVEFGSTS